MREIAVLIGLFTCWPSLGFGQYFTDMFTASSLNSSFWQALTPYSDSSVVEGSGSVTLTNAGGLFSVVSVPQAVDITLKFRFTGSAHDQYIFTTRTTGASTNGEGSFDEGIYFGLQMQNDTGQTSNNVGIQHENYPFSASLAQGTYPINLNQDYTVRIVDDGTNLALYINDTTTPLLRATDSSTFGNKVGMNNRQGAAAGSTISAGSQVKISAFTINSPTVITNTVTVPSANGQLVNLSTLGSSGFTMGFVISGTTAQTVLIRGVGPTLANFGIGNAATQTMLTLYSGKSVIGANTGWSAEPNASQISAAFTSTGAFVLPTGSADSAILTMLNPGPYTATVTGNGAVLLEAYAVP